MQAGVKRSDRCGGRLASPPSCSPPAAPPAWGHENKLLADIGGKPMVRRVVETALASTARPVLVVTGHMAADVGAALAGVRRDAWSPIPTYATGLASSLKAGIRAVPADCGGILVLLGDMPRVAPGAYRYVARRLCGR